MSATLRTTRARERRAAIAPALALFVGVLGLYLLTLTQVHTFDALSYVTSVERKPWTELFHPHHLAYGPLGALALWAARALGYHGGAALPLQIVNAAAGALGAALLFATARRVTGRADAALGAALTLAGSYAYWYYAVEIEVYTLAALFLIVCLDLMMRPWPPGRRRLVALGLAHGGATLFHQTNVLLGVPISVLALLDFSRQYTAGSMQRQELRATRAARGAWLVRWCLYGLTFGLTVGLPYLYAMLVVSGFRTLDQAIAWLTEYARTGWWGGPLTAEKLADLGRGLADTLAQPGGGWAWLALTLLGASGLRRKARGSRQRSTAPPTSTASSPSSQSLAPWPWKWWLLAWLVTYGAFFVWWEPENIEFWIAGLPPLLLLLALGLAHGPAWGWRPLAALGVATAMIVVNYGAITRRGDASTDLQRVVARELAARSTPADLLVVPDGLLELYLPHYERRENFLSLNQALFDAGGDAGAACEAIRGRIDAALHAGATALIADEALHPPAELLARYRLSQPQIDACFAPYRAILMPLALPAPVPAYWRLPLADELAAGAGWQFDTFSLGWRAANVEGERFDGGWRFRPQRDPALITPLLALDAARYGALEVRLANSTAARDAQLFFAGPDGRIEEGRAVRWELEDTDEPTTYQVQLRGAPGWEGAVTRLRLDPVGAGDGGEVRVEWVRLVPAP